MRNTTTTTTTATATTATTARRTFNWKNRVARGSSSSAWGDTVAYFVPISGVKEVTEEIGAAAWRALYKKEFANWRNSLYPSSFTYKGIVEGGILMEWYTSCGP
jgi:hypothetical protein